MLILIGKLLKHVPDDKLYPVIDLLRFLIFHHVILSCCLHDSALLSHIMKRCCYQDNANDNAHMMAGRLIANFTSHLQGAKFFSAEQWINNLLLDFVMCSTNDTSAMYSRYLTNIGAVLYNLSPYFPKSRQATFQSPADVVISILSHILSKEEKCKNVVEDVVTNLLGALANILYCNDGIIVDLQSKSLTFLEDFRLRFGKNEKILFLLKDIHTILVM